MIHRSREIKTLLVIIFTVLCLVAGAEESKLKVVSLAPSLTELIYQLGAGDCLIGRSEVCNYPAEAKNIPVMGRFAEPFTEKIIRAKPELVVTCDLLNPMVINNLKKAGIEVKKMQCRNIEDYKQCVSELGELLGRREAASAERERIESKLREISAFKPLNLNVLWVIWDSPLMVGGRNSLPDSLLKLTRASNIAGESKEEYFKCSYDWLLEHQPDVIIWTEAVPELKNHRFWGKLKAVQQNRVIANLNPDLTLRPGPRLFDGIIQLRMELEKFK